MFSRFERMMALRYLCSRQKEGFVSIIVTFSVLGIMLGVAAIIVVMAVMQGFRNELMDRILGINAHMSVLSYEQNIQDYATLAERLQQIEDVTYAMPVINEQALATANGLHMGASVRAIDIANLKKKMMVSDNIVLGDINDLTGRDTVIIGSRMAQHMRLVPGDAIRLISPKTTETIFASIPRLKDYTVVGVFDVGMYEYDSSTIFMPLAAGQLYFDMERQAGSVELYVEDRDAMWEVRRAIEAALPDDLYLVDWRQANSDFVSSLDVERSAMFLILALIMCVAGFMILSGLWMLVISKKKEIAILRTMGATRGAVMRIFFLCGAVIGIVGTGLGLALGIGFATHIQEIRAWIEATFDTSLFPAAVYFLTNIPSDVRWDDVTRVVVLSLSVAFLATVPPARRAAKTPPAEGLRYE